jgi:hypothetical protein
VERRKQSKKGIFGGDMYAGDKDSLSGNISEQK